MRKGFTNIVGAVVLVAVALVVSALVSYYAALTAERFTPRVLPSVQASAPSAMLYDIDTANGTYTYIVSLQFTLPASSEPIRVPGGAAAFYIYGANADEVKYCPLRSPVVLRPGSTTIVQLECVFTADELDRVFGGVPDTQTLAASMKYLYFAVEGYQPPTGGGESGGMPPICVGPGCSIIII